MTGETEPAEEARIDQAMPKPIDADEERRTVRTFAAASFLNDMGSDMIYPIWPLFVTEVLGANMAVLGLLDGLGEAMVSISQAASGYASDRLGKRKVFIWTGYLMGALSRVGYAIALTWQALVPFRLLDRAGKMRGAPRDALVADASTRATRGGNFGLLRAADHLGATVGVLLCMVLFPLLGHRTVFMIAAVPTVVGAGLIIFIIRERRAEGESTFKGLSLHGLSRDLKLLVVLSAVFALGAFTYSFLLIHAQRLGVSDAYIPALYLIFTVVASLLSLPFGRLADTWGRRRVLAAAYALWGLVCVVAIGLRLVGAMPLLFVLFGAHKAALEPSQRAIVAEMAPEGLRGSILGGFNMVVGLAALPASLLAGVLWDRLAPGVPFMASLGLTIIATLLLVFVREPEGE